MEGCLFSSDLIFNSVASLQGTSLDAMCLAQEYVNLVHVFLLNQRKINDKEVVRPVQEKEGCCIMH